jgi:hypothetical protein
MRLKVLSLIARMLGIQFHFEGRPFGGAARPMAVEDCS